MLMMLPGAFGLDQTSGGLGRNEPRALQIGVEYLVPLRLAMRQDKLAGAHACIVHHHVDRASDLFHVIERRDHRGRFGHIHRHGMRHRALRL